MIVAYGGTFTFDGQRAIHNVDIAWNEVCLIPRK